MNGFRRRGNARLIVSLALPSASRTAAVYRADAGNHNQEAFPAGAPDRSDFMGGRHDAVHACFLRKASQLNHTLGSGACDPYPPEFGVIHARKDRNC